MHFLETPLLDDARERHHDISRVIDAAASDDKDETRNIAPDSRDPSDADDKDAGAESSE